MGNVEILRSFVYGGFVGGIGGILAVTYFTPLTFIQTISTSAVFGFISAIVIWMLLVTLKVIK